jgi:hypothetical protein
LGLDFRSQPVFRLDCTRLAVRAGLERQREYAAEPEDIVKVEFVKELHDFAGLAALVKRGNQYFVVSSVIAPFSGFETLVFLADENGEVTSWDEVAGGRGVSREEAITELASLSEIKEN